jgi:hypothetical protein
VMARFHIFANLAEDYEELGSLMSQAAKSQYLLFRYACCGIPAGRLGAAYLSRPRCANAVWRVRLRRRRAAPPDPREDSSKVSPPSSSPRRPGCQCHRCIRYATGGAEPKQTTYRRPRRLVAVTSLCQPRTTHQTSLPKRCRWCRDCDKKYGPLPPIG